MHNTSLYVCFFFNDTATTEIYTLSLHDALPISDIIISNLDLCRTDEPCHLFLGLCKVEASEHLLDRKSTRLNSSHANISYAVFCLKKKKKQPRYSSLTHSSLVDTHPRTLHSLRF